MSSEIVFAIIVTSIATYSSRFLGMLTSLRINENSRIYRWFNCIAYSTLAALISRILIFPNGVLMDTNYFIRVIVILISILIFFISKKNLVYPTIFSAIILTLMSSYYSWMNQKYLKDINSYFFVYFVFNSKFLQWLLKESQFLYKY